MGVEFHPDYQIGKIGAKAPISFAAIFGYGLNSTPYAVLYYVSGNWSYDGRMSMDFGGTRRGVRLARVGKNFQTGSKTVPRLPSHCDGNGMRCGYGRNSSWVPC